MILISHSSRTRVKIHKLNEQRQNPRNLSRRYWRLIRNTFARGRTNEKIYVYSAVPRKCTGKPQIISIWNIAYAKDTYYSLRSEHRKKEKTRSHI